MCGGTRHRQDLHGILNGLSPRVRGNPVLRKRQATWQRSIPACAGEPRCEYGDRDWDSVYPRVCGGTTTPSNFRAYVMGLSPRVRGNRRNGLRDLIRRGSIPACAGEPPSAEPRRRREWVYPRVCGGTRKGLHSRLARPGSIPACAGEPERRTRRRAGHEVYPRVCGGTMYVVLSVSSATGLSPRVRGNRGASHRPRRQRGSIPACAGEPLANVIEYARYYSYIKYC